MNHVAPTPGAVTLNVDSGMSSHSTSRRNNLSVTLHVKPGNRSTSPKISHSQIDEGSVVDTFQLNVEPHDAMQV